jgi:hypothetical protein
MVHLVEGQYHRPLTGLCVNQHGDAAILVVRSGRRPPIAWSTCLEAIGVEPLGEVASFVPTTAGSQP